MTKIDSTADIHKTAIIGKNVSIGKFSRIGAHCLILGNTQIGDYCVFDGFCSIGNNAEHKDFFDKEGQTIIKDSVRVREFVTINAGTTGITFIGDNCVFLRGSHVGHDTIMEENCTISCNSLIGGHSYIMQNVNFGLGAIVHQYSVIGSFSMLGMGCIVNKQSNIEPGKVFVDNPARELKPNFHLIDKYKLSEEDLKQETIRFNELKDGIRNN